MDHAYHMQREGNGNEMNRWDEVMEVRNLTAEDGVKYRLSYTRITTESEEQPGLLLYGIGISMIRKDGTECREESDEVLCLTESKELAENYLHALANVAITPLCLAEMLDDLMTEQERKSYQS